MSHSSSSITLQHPHPPYRVLFSLLCIVASALCKAALWHLNRHEETWVTEKLLLYEEFLHIILFIGSPCSYPSPPSRRPELFMALFYLVVVFGHAYIVGQQHFDEKTFFATVPMFAYALALYAVLTKYERAPSVRSVLSLVCYSQ